jgi:F0F1-type ATP synthase assembly protein I
MSHYSNGDDDPYSRAALYQWSARMSGIAFEMVIPPLLGVGLDRLCGTVVLFALIGSLLGMALGFWQLLKIAKEVSGQGGKGVDKPPNTGDNEGI